ncbi:MAG: hypothetical protein AB3N23_07045 [Paracoccaceae bacterium]
MLIRFAFLAATFAMCAPVAQANTIVVNGRFVVAKETVRSMFYRQNKGNKRTVFDVRWSD